MFCPAFFNSYVVIYFSTSSFMGAINFGDNYLCFDSFPLIHWTKYKFFPAKQRGLCHFIKFSVDTLQNAI